MKKNKFFERLVDSFLFMCLSIAVAMAIYAVIYTVIKIKQWQFIEWLLSL